MHLMPSLIKLIHIIYVVSLKANIFKKCWYKNQKLEKHIQGSVTIQSNLVITRSSGGIFWDRGISEARYRFCRQVFFFYLVYIF